MPNRPSREAIQERPNLGRSVTVTLKDGSTHVGYVQRIAIKVAGLLDNAGPIEDEDKDPDSAIEDEDKDPDSALLRGLEPGVYYQVHGIKDRMVPKQDVIFNTITELGTRAENITLKFNESESRGLLELLDRLDLRLLQGYTPSEEAALIETLTEVGPTLKTLRGVLEASIESTRLGEWYTRIRRDRDERDDYFWPNYDEYDEYEDASEDDEPHI